MSIDVTKRVEVYNGKYTITSPSGDHRTFRIATCLRGPLKDKRIVSLLNGPDNQSHFKGFGFLTDKGITVWQKCRSDHFNKLAALLYAMAKFGNDCGFARQGFKVQMSKRCAVCNRELTDPKSLDFGIGPVCRGDTLSNAEEGFIGDDDYDDHDQE